MPASGGPGSIAGTGNLSQRGLVVQDTTMVQAEPVPAARRGRLRSVLRFTLHYLGMIVAMVVGMVALGPLWHLAWPALQNYPSLDAVVMVTNMSIAMLVWMRIRGHDWMGIFWMCAAMYAGLALVLPPYWAGRITEGDMMMGAHGLMLPLMLVVMLVRPHRHHDQRGRPGPA